MMRTTISSVAVLCALSCGGSDELGNESNASADADESKASGSTTSDDDPSSTVDEQTSSSDSSEGAQDEGGTPEVSSEGEDGQSSADCTIPEFEDDIKLDFAGAGELSGAIVAMAVLADGLVACGDDFVTHFDPKTTTQATAKSQTPCTAMSPVGSDRFVVATTTGELQLWRVSGDGPPELLNAKPGLAPDSKISGLAVREQKLWAAAGAAGVLQFEIEGEQLVSAETLTGPTSARDVAIVGDQLVVADGFSGTRLYDFEGRLRAEMGHFGEARKLVVQGQRVLVLQGIRGFDLLEVDEGGELELLATHPPDGMARDALLVEGDLLVNLTHSLVRYRLDDSGLQTLSRERRPERSELGRPWFLALAGSEGRGQRLFTAIGARIVPLSLGDGAPAPDVHAVLPRLLVSGPAPSTLGSIFVFENTGTAPAIVHGFELDEGFVPNLDPDELPPQRPGCPDQYLLDPGEDMYFGFEHTLTTDEPHLGRLALNTNDPDEPRLETTVMVNRPTAETGAEFADLSLVSWHGEQTQLSQFRGNVVFMKLVNSS